MYYVRSASELTYRDGVRMDINGKYIVTDFDDLTTEIVSYDTIKEVYKQSPDRFVNLSVVNDLFSINYIWNDIVVGDNISMSNSHGSLINGVRYYLHPDSNKLIEVSKDKIFSCPMSRFNLLGWANTIFTLGNFACIMGYHVGSKTRILTLFNKKWEYIMTYAIRLKELKEAVFISLDNKQMDVRLRLTSMLQYFTPYL